MRWFVLILCLFTQTAYADLYSGLIDHWKIDENTGTTTTGTEGDDLTFYQGTGAIDWTTGKVGYGLDIERDETQQLYADYKLAFTNDEVSICLWLDPESKAQYQSIVGQTATSGLNGFELLQEITTGYALFAADTVSGRSTVTGTTDLSTGGWHHVCGVYDGAYVRVYVDGVEEGTPVALTGNIDWSNNGYFKIGGRSGTVTIPPVGSTQTYDGLLDEVFLYDRALTPEEVKQIYNFSRHNKMYAYRTQVQ